MASPDNTATCPECSMTYKAFRCASIHSYADAYHQIAWQRQHTGKAAVLGFWGRCKAAEWAHHLDTCGTVVDFDEVDAADFSDEDGDSSFDFGANLDAAPEADAPEAVEAVEAAPQGPALPVAAPVATEAGPAAEGPAEAVEAEGPEGRAEAARGPPDLFFKEPTRGA